MKADAAKVVAAIARRYRPPAWALFEQVANGTGFSASRWADVMAMSIWPSHGLHLHGFEVKVSRNDWLRELKNPAKAEIANQCDYWWLVVGGAGIAELHEVPDAWGLLELSHGKLYTRRQAPKRDAVELGRPMLAAILRRAAEGMVPESSIEDRIEESYRRGRDRGANDAEVAGVRALRELETLRESVAMFERKSGLSINGYNGEHLGAKVARLDALDTARSNTQLAGIERALSSALEHIRYAVATAAKHDQGHDPVS
jgi:hypothetical protein